MTHNPDMQKDAIIKAWKDNMRAADAVAQGQHLRKRPSGESDLADQFESILYGLASTEKRRGELLMNFAWNNRHEIIEGLRLRNNQERK